VPSQSLKDALLFFLVARAIQVDVDVQRNNLVDLVLRGLLARGGLLRMIDTVIDVAAAALVVFDPASRSIRLVL